MAGILELLEKAWPKPQTLPHAPGSALALSLHCLMVQGGFTVRHDTEGGSSGPSSSQATSIGKSSYVPPSKWIQEPDVYQFSYCKDGKASSFTLIVSVHAPSGRVFVHASEDGNLNNIKVLGLQLENYMPNPSLLKNNRWQPGCLQNEAALVSSFFEWILGPLVADAEDLSPTSLAAQRSRHAQHHQHQQRNHPLQQHQQHGPLVDFTWSGSVSESGGPHGGAYRGSSGSGGGSCGRAGLQDVWELVSGGYGGAPAKPYASYLAMSAAAVAALAGATAVYALRARSLRA